MKTALLIKQISSGSTNHNSISMIFAGTVLSNFLFKFQSTSILAICFNWRKETVSMSKYMYILKEQSSTIIF